MITKHLFRKNYIIFASIILIFIVIAISSSWILTSFERDQFHTGPRHMSRDLLRSFDDDPFVALPKLNKFSQFTHQTPHDLISQDGKSLINGRQLIPALSPEQLRLIEQDEMVTVSSPGERRPTVLSKTNKDGVILLSTIGPPPGERKPIGPLVTLAALIVCVLISIGVALFYQFSKYHERSLEAFAVLNSLREGNLSSRLPQKKMDELHPLIEAFNQMANDVEKMVEQLRAADQSRRQLLQDLAHDLRTPLTSLKTFLETLHMAGDRLNEQKRQEVLTLCISEVTYFGKLVEDLLFLAQITEPKYSLGTEKIDLEKKLQEQRTIFQERQPNLNFKMTVSGQDFKIMGSEKLIDRLLRNALDNSSSFAKDRLEINISEDSHTVSISIIDNGPGFTEKALQEFGHKKASRAVSEAAEGQRISVGIGSVIMKEITMLHSGTLRAENLKEGSKIMGAKVSFAFKKP